MATPSTAGGVDITIGQTGINRVMSYQFSYSNSSGSIITETLSEDEIDSSRSYLVIFNDDFEELCYYKMLFPVT